MSSYDISPELDDKLKNSLKNQGQFLEDISLVYAMQTFPILVPSQIFYFENNGAKTLPVFTTPEDLEIFQKDLANIKTKWELRPIREILVALMQMEIEAVAFNPKLEKDEDHGNTAYFDKKDLLGFIGYYTEILNVMLDSKNMSIDKKERTYLVPLFIWKDEKEEVNRGFANLVAKDGREFVPVFDNLNSLALWYNEPYFSEAFKENQGQILPITLKELRHPENGVNHFGNTHGITIDPLDTSGDDYEKTVMMWDEIE
ncbi:MAG: hypothetical protein WAX22_00315 [Lactococcus hircilactis]